MYLQCVSRSSWSTTTLATLISAEPTILLPGLALKWKLLSIECIGVGHYLSQRQICLKVHTSWWLSSEVWWVYQLTSICLSSAQLKESTDRKCTAHTYCTYVFLVSKARFGLSFFSYNVQNWNITKALTKYERPKMKRDVEKDCIFVRHLFSFLPVRISFGL